jgi:hypothetical protein
MKSIEQIYLLSKERELNAEDLEKFLLIFDSEMNKSYRDGAMIELILFCNDINDFLDKHLDALEIVNSYQKETEYLIGFKQGLLMFKSEFEFMLNLKNDEKI